jgi:purine-cytosine permease-like protein
MAVIIVVGVIVLAVVLACVSMAGIQSDAEEYYESQSQRND